MTASVERPAAVRALLEAAVTKDGFPRISFTVAEVSAMTGIPRRTLYDLMARGELAYLPVGERGRYVPTAALIEFLEDARQHTATT